jgi:hypothetical protein
MEVVHPYSHSAVDKKRYNYILSRALKSRASAAKSSATTNAEIPSVPCLPSSVFFVHSVEATELSDNLYRTQPKLHPFFTSV